GRELAGSGQNRHDELAAAIVIKCAEVGGLIRIRIRTDTPLQVLPELPTGHLTAPFGCQLLGQTFDQTPGKQRVFLDGAIVQRTLVFEGGGDDAPAMPGLQRIKMERWLGNALTPAVGRERDAAMACIDDHEDMARRKTRDVLEPAIELQPGRRYVPVG